MEKKYSANIIIYICLALFTAVCSNAAAEIKLPVSPLHVPVDATPSMEINDNSADSYSAGLEPVKTGKPLSKSKAVLLTMLAPGAGHFYIGEKGRGEVFLGAEIATWFGFFAFRTYGNWREDDYIRFAKEHAGIDPDGKDDEFYGQLTFYDSREEYNTAGRIYNPGDPYFPNTQSYYWQWDSQTSRENYRDIRNSSQAAFRNANFMIGVAIANRVLAAIDIFRLARNWGKQNKNSISDVDLSLDSGFISNNPSLSITFTRRF